VLTQSPISLELEFVDRYSYHVPVDELLLPSVELDDALVELDEEELLDEQ
jgi:hypothetical protein